METLFATPERYKDLLTRLVSLAAEAEMMAVELDPEVTEFHVLSEQILGIVQQHTDNLTMAQLAEVAIEADAALMERIGKLVPVEVPPAPWP